MQAKKICQPSVMFQNDATSSIAKSRPPAGAGVLSAHEAAGIKRMRARTDGRAEGAGNAGCASSGHKVTLVHLVAETLERPQCAADNGERLVCRLAHCAFGKEREVYGAL